MEGTKTIIRWFLENKPGKELSLEPLGLPEEQLTSDDTLSVGGAYGANGQSRVENQEPGMTFALFYVLCFMNLEPY